MDERQDVEGVEGHHEDTQPGTPPGRPDDAVEGSQRDHARDHAGHAPADAVVPEEGDRAGHEELAEWGMLGVGVEERGRIRVVRAGRQMQAEDHPRRVHVVALVEDQGALGQVQPGRP